MDDSHVELPVDASGKHIHVLDYIADSNGCCIHVHALILQKDKWLACQYGLLSPMDMVVDNLDKWHVVDHCEECE